MEDYVKVLLHGNIPPSSGFVLVDQITPFQVFLKVVVLPPPHSTPFDLRVMKNYTSIYTH
jgi:hypothetical protein